jgi:hypothetical protein
VRRSNGERSQARKELFLFEGLFQPTHLIGRYWASPDRVLPFGIENLCQGAQRRSPRASGGATKDDPNDCTTPPGQSVSEHESSARKRAGRSLPAMRGHREPEHTRSGMQRGRACPRAAAAVGVLCSLRGAVDRRPVDGTRTAHGIPSPALHLSTSPMFRGAFRRHRCLVVADGVYEWRKNRVRRRTPFFIRLKSGHPFGFAGIWSMKHDEKWTRLATCAIATCPPNDLMAKTGCRCSCLPVRVIWLDPTASETELREIARSAS